MTDEYTSEDYHADMEFTESSIKEKLVNLLSDQSHLLEEGTVTVVNEWGRKGYPERGPLTATSPYRSKVEDVVVTLEVRIPSWGQTGSAETFVTTVNEVLATRAKERTAVRQAEKAAKIAKLEAEIAELRK